MFDDRLICEDSLKAVGDGFCLQIRPNWYRGVPLSWVSALELKVDGTDIDEDGVTVCVDQRKWPVAELANASDDFWFLSDAATVTVHQGDVVQSGSTHDVELLLSLWLPYIIVGDDQFLISTDRARKTLIAR
jgi:hypothetical protein